MAPLGYSSPAPSVGDAFISQTWLTGTVYTGGCLYVLLSGAALLLLVIECTGNKKGVGEWKLRPIALALVFLQSALDACFWFLLATKYWTLSWLYYALSLAPSVIQCVILFLCMYMFGTIFYQVYFASVLSEYEVSMRQQRRAKIQVGVSIGAAVLASVGYGLSFALSPVSYEVSLAVITGVVDLVAGCSFPVYLGYLYRRRHQHSTRARYQHRLLQTLTVTVLLSCCSVVRGIVVLMWRSMTLSFAREVYWCFCVCAYAVTEMLPLAWVLVLFKVLPLDSDFVLVGTSDANYWANRSKSVHGHDFQLIGERPSESESDAAVQSSSMLE